VPQGSPAPGWGAAPGAGPAGTPWPPAGGPQSGVGHPAAGYPPGQPGPGAAGPAAPAGGAPGFPGYPMATPPRTDSKAVVGLVCAVASFVLCPVVLAVVALVLAGMSDRDIGASGGRLEGHAMNTATRWVAWINIALSVIGLVVLLAVFFLLLSSGTSPSGEIHF
jgi:hypothetical protein